MVEQKQAVVEAEEQKTEETQETKQQETEQQKTEQQSVAEDKIVPKVDESGEEGKTSSDQEKDADSKQDDGEIGEELSLEDFDEFSKESEPEEKSGYQKRIDGLIARVKAAEDEVALLKKQRENDDVEYTNEQLSRAWRKGVEEQNAILQEEVITARLKKAQKEAIEGERKRQMEAIEQQKKAQQEWASIVEEYSQYSDPNVPEIYKGSHKDLNISSQNSLVYKLATALFRDPKRAERYQRDGGQRLAVSDALRFIRQKKNAKIESKETTILKRKLAKEKQKTSVSSGKAMKAESSAPISHKTSLEDYINERKKAKVAISGDI